MQTQVLKRQLCAQVGSFLEYPAQDSQIALQAVISQLEEISEAACFYLKDFCSQMEKVDLGKRQEYYVQSFDLTPQCSLYLSIHLFGEESFKRSELMTGLKSVYEQSGPFEMNELPDHLAVVLKQNALFDDEEWSELVSMCILPVLPKMIAKLEKYKNPYVLVLRTVQELLVKVENAHV